MTFADYFHYADSQHDEAPLYIHDRLPSDESLRIDIKDPPLSGPSTSLSIAPLIYFTVIEQDRILRMEKPSRWLTVGPARSGSPKHNVFGLKDFHRMGVPRDP